MARRNLLVVRPGLGPALLGLADDANARASEFLTKDPVGLLHRTTDPLDVELLGLVASAVAYGRVDLFRPRLFAWSATLGDRPSHRLRDASAKEIRDACQPFSYRMTGPGELAALVAAGLRLQRDSGSIGAALVEASHGAPDHRTTLANFVDRLWDFDLAPFVGSRKPTRRLLHLVASPKRGSACKRLNLYLRWMVRGPDGVDVGLWRYPASRLVIPLDTHVHRIGRLLGLTRRNDLSWRTADEVTDRLRALDPDDPVRFDFALSHRGISAGCRSRRVESICGPCALRPECKVWRGAK